MSVDVVDLRNFYAQPLGMMARRLVGRGIRRVFPDVRGQRVLGVGYPTPYLGLFREEAERCLAFMPAAQGVVKWPSASPSLCALTEEHEFPLVEGAVDRLILVHVIENAQAPSALLAECWRVLAPGGRLLAVVPNRASAWARVEATPFGHGRPYSRGQVTRLLRDALFTPVGWAEALYIPPVQWRWFLRSAVALERFGAAFSMPMNGVHMVEAVKQLYRPVPARKEKRRLIPALEPQLAPQGMGRDDAATGA